MQVADLGRSDRLGRIWRRKRYRGELEVQPYILVSEFVGVSVHLLPYFDSGDMQVLLLLRKGGNTYVG